MGLMHRANPMKMLQRMSGVENIASLKMLADLLQPTRLGVRVKTRTYSSLVPLNRMVDAVLPESEMARKFGDTVARAVANPAGSIEDFRQIRRLLSAWKDNSTGLKPIIGQSFLLKEIEPLTETLSESIETGLQALDYLESRQRPLEDWKGKAALTLERAEKTHSEMLIAIAPALKILVNAASSIL